MGNHPPKVVTEPGPHGIPVVTHVPPSAEELHAWHVTPHAGGLHCADEAGCHAEHDRREPEWIDHQFNWRPAYAKVQQARIDWAKVLRARQFEQELAQQRRFPRPVSEYEWTSLAEASRPPDSFFSDLAIALAARREERGQQIELAAGGEGIYGETYDQPGPASSAMLSDPWAHTMRNPAHRAHTLGHMRGHLHGVTDAASALARRTVA